MLWQRLWKNPRACLSPASTRDEDDLLFGLVQWPVKNSMLTRNCFTVKS